MAVTTGAGKEIMRKVIKVYTSFLTKEGEGFPIYRAFPTPSIRHIDPFLLFDEMGPVKYQKGKAKGAPPHPHKGFETLTYILEGEMEHRDSQGNSAILRTGSAQIMTAGKGIVHSEMPTKSFFEKGGLMHGFQLWINIPKENKLADPAYQELQPENLPQGKPIEGSHVKVIVGNAFGMKSPIRTMTEMTFLHVKISPYSKFLFSIPAGFSAFAYVLSGHGKFGPTHAAHGANPHQMILFEPLLGSIQAENGALREDFEFLVISGIMLNENVVQHGCFVMNSEKEIQEAWEDFYNGKYGRLEPK